MGSRFTSRTPDGLRVWGGDKVLHDLCMSETDEIV